MLLGNDDSPVVWEGQPAWSHYVFLWVFVGIISLRSVMFLLLGYGTNVPFHFALVGMLIALAIFLRRTTRYRVTRQAVHRAYGILGKGDQGFPLADFESVDFFQGPLDRLFNSGTVVLVTKVGERIRLGGVKDPEVVCNKIKALF